MLQEDFKNFLMINSLLPYFMHFILYFLAPYGAPRNFSGYNISASQIQLFWEDVEKEQKNGVIQGYKIFYHVEGATTELAENVPISILNPSSPPMTTTLDSLLTYSLYNISIAGYTTYSGDGKRSQAIFIKTDSDSKFILI